MSANLEYATGRPVTLPIGTYRYGGGTRLAYSQRNTYRIPDYFRLDLAVNIDPGHYLKRLTHMSWTVGVYNVTARKNAYSVFFEGLDSYMLSVFACPIPYVNLNLKF
ncbi:MAG: TonB-dependent receptor [Bacteroidales bacterium]|nr:TonB-dependent receptor [Bacteroidales bacterium]